MHILIFGGGGFLGKRLANELIENKALTAVNLWMLPWLI
jgi:nucleoside-diphosphate-sugar epimerase